MAVWGEVSYKVKRAITFHQRFTLAELVDATGLSYEQVEQVVQRLVKGGYVHKLKRGELYEAEKISVKKVGRPRERYALTEHEEKREEFFAAVEAIASGERMSRASERRPSTVYYEAALEIVGALESGKEALSDSRIEEAAALLVYGRDYEALIPEGSEIAQAYYDVALARAEALRGAYQVAERLLTRARVTLREAGLVGETSRVDEFVLSMRVGRQLSMARGASGHIVSVEPLEVALDLLREGRIADRPLLGLFRDTIEMTIATLPERTLEEKVEEYSNRIVHEVLEKLDVEWEVWRKEKELRISLRVREDYAGRRLTGAPGAAEDDGRRIER